MLVCIQLHHLQALSYMLRCTPAVKLCVDRPHLCLLLTCIYEAPLAAFRLCVLSWGPALKADMYSDTINIL